MKSVIRNATKVIRTTNNQVRSSPIPSTSTLKFKHQFSTSAKNLEKNKQTAEESGESTADSSNKDESSSSSNNKKEKSKAKEEPTDTTVPGRSPFQAFVDVMKEEIRKNREFQESVKQLQGEATKVQDSEAMKKAKDVYERARLMASIKENPRLAAAAEELRKAGLTVNDAVSTAMKGMEENALIRGSREAIMKGASAAANVALNVSEPLRSTEAYKAVASEISEAIDDAASNVQHGGYIEKEDRRRRREARLVKAGKAGGLAARKAKVEINPDAGEAVQLHATANIETKSRLASLTPEPIAQILSALSNSYQESENPVIGTMRSVTSTIGRFFDETETAKVTKWVKEMDPVFTTEAFLRELREYIVPELVDAYVNADQATLKLWCSEATYNVMMATLQPYVSPTMVSESRVLDIRNLDFVSSKILENNLHVFVISWRTQEILAYRDLKTGEITQGDENKIEQVGYVAVVTRVEEELENTVTGGWKIIDMARRAG